LKIWSFAKPRHWCVIRAVKNRQTMHRTTNSTWSSRAALDGCIGGGESLILGAFAHSWSWPKLGIIGLKLFCRIAGAGMRAWIDSGLVGAPASYESFRPHPGQEMSRPRQSSGNLSFFWHFWHRNRITALSLRIGLNRAFVRNVVLSNSSYSNGSLSLDQREKLVSTYSGHAMARLRAKFLPVGGQAS
jgi:hypothetical protein